MSTMKDAYLLNSSEHLVRHIMRSFSVARQICEELKARGCRVEIDRESWDVKVYDKEGNPVGHKLLPGTVKAPDEAPAKTEETWT